MSLKLSDLVDCTKNQWCPSKGFLDRMRYGNCRCKFHVVDWFQWKLSHYFAIKKPSIVKYLFIPFNRIYFICVMFNWDELCCNELESICYEIWNCERSLDSSPLFIIACTYLFFVLCIVHIIYTAVIIFLLICWNL